MDEMKTLEGFRADAPTPDRARLAPGRQRLLDAAATRDPGWSGRVRWKIVAPAAAAALTALVVLGVQTWPGSSRDESRAANGVSFLETAARGIEKTGTGEPAPRLRPDQWAYSITVRLWRPPPGKTRDAPLPKECAVEIPGLGASVVQTQVSEFWRRGDGQKGAGASHYAGRCGKMKSFNMSAGPYPTYGRPIGYYYEFAARPHKPERLVVDMRAAGIDGSADIDRNDADGDFRGLVGLFHMPLKTSPEFTATVYRAMSRIPGVTVSQEYDQVFGRTVAVVAREGDAKSAKKPSAELLLDPKTYRVLGMRTRAGTEGLKIGKVLYAKPGEVMDHMAFGGVHIVDELGGKS